MDRYEIIGPVAYQGKEGCGSPRCTRAYYVDEDGNDESRCIGWHCSYCDEPCSMMGHRCDAADAILGASRAILDEGRDDVPRSGS